jgi:cell division protein FtsX
MTIRDRFWMTFRHVKVSLVGSVLVILAISIGVALAAATTAFIVQYNKQSDELLNHPIYREIYVEALADPTAEVELPLPVVELSGDLKNVRQFNLVDFSKVLQSVSGLTHAYLADGAAFTATTYLMGNDKDIIASKQAVGRAGKAPAGAGKGTPETGRPETEEGAPEKAVPEKDSKGEYADWTKDLKNIAELPVEEFSGIYTTPDFFDAYNIQTASGSLFTEEDLGSGNQVMVLGSSLAEILFPNGKALGSKISVNYQTYTILGILEPSNLVEPENGRSLNDFAYTPHYLFSGTAFGKKGGGLPTLRFAVEDSDNIHQAVLQIEEYLVQEYPDVNLRVTAAVDQLESENQRLSRILTVLVFLTAAGLFIAAINMFNLLLIKVIKQTKGIGVLRALGYTKNNVFQQFLFESFAMSFAGALIGLAASPLLFKFLQSALITRVGTGSGSFYLDLLFGGAAAFVFSILFGIYPAYVARQTEIAAALRAE